MLFLNSLPNNARVHWILSQDTGMRLVGGVLTWTEDVTINTSWPMWIFAALGLLVLVWCWFRRRNQKRWYFWPLPLLLPCLILIAGSAVNNYFGLYVRLGDLLDQYPFPTASASTLAETSGNYPQGVSVVTDIPGTQSGVGIHSAFVWLPPQYFAEPTKKFPVVYLLPGSPGTSADWSTGGNVTTTGLTNAQNGNPAILVSASIGDNQLADTECVDGAQGNWQTYLAVDVPAYVNENARTLPGAKNQAVAGLSEGGYCAQVLSLRNPTTFGLFGNFAGTTMPTYGGGMDALFGDQQNLTATVNSYSSNWLIVNQPQSRSVVGKVLIGAQDDPALIDDEAQFVTKAKSLGMNVTMQQPPGSHSFYFWTTALQIWLPWALEQMGKASPLPS